MGFSLAVETVDSYAAFGPVRIIVMPGNHDSLLTWTLGKALEAYYKDCPDITFDSSPEEFKYHQFGKVLLGFNHGKGPKAGDWSKIMPADVPKMWGDTEHREFHIGHTHAKEVWEDAGIKVRVMPALSGKCYWTNMKGYRSTPAGELLLWDPEDGEVCNYRIRVDES